MRLLLTHTVFNLIQLYIKIYIDIHCSLTHFYRKLLYKMGQDFLDMKEEILRERETIMKHKTEITIVTNNVNN